MMRNYKYFREEQTPCPALFSLPDSSSVLPPAIVTFIIQIKQLLLKVLRAITCKKLWCC